MPLLRGNLHAHTTFSDGIRSPEALLNEYEARGYDFLAITHAATVIFTLLWLPFGKFFHIFQRPAQLGVKLYQSVGERDPGTACARCGQRFASAMQIQDLERVLPELGFDYRIAGPAGTWQRLCPPCKRTALATAQLRLQEQTRG